MTIDRLIRYAATGADSAQPHRKVVHDAVVTVVEYLLVAGGDIDNVLQEAASSGNIQLFSWAMNNGATLPENRILSEALYHAIQQNDKATIQQLHVLCTDPFEYCIEEDNLEVMVELMNLKQNVNPKVIQNGDNINRCRSIFSYLSLISNSKL